MLIDSNILIYSLTISSPKYRAAQFFLQKYQQKLVIAHQNYLETLRVITHKKFPQPFEANAAQTAINEITMHATVIYPSQTTLAINQSLVKKYHITGTEIFDAYLVATALTNQVTTIATDNTKHLRKYQEITLVNPFA
ncbi:MAG: PIN domain-containing protein [Patescibacteria group bacterium]